MGNRPRALALGIALALNLAQVSAVRADEVTDPAPTPRVALAESLYREGRRLMAEEHYEEAIQKFAESNRLDPATGTLMNLAACHKAVGKLATAWLQFNNAVVAARRDQREDRVQYIKEQLAEIEPSLSYLTISVPESSRLQGLEVRLDSVLIGEAAYGVSTPIDPGPHRITARAPGKASWSQQVLIGEERDRWVLTVPALASKSTVGSRSTVDPTTAPSEGNHGLSVTRDREIARPIPLSVYVAAGTTAVWLGAAAVTGVIYLNEKGDYDKERNDTNVSDEVIRIEHADTQHLSAINAGLWALTAVGAGLTVYLYATRPTQAQPALSPEFSAWATPQAGGISARTAF